MNMNMYDKIIREYQDRDDRWILRLKRRGHSQECLYHIMRQPDQSVAHCICLVRGAGKAIAISLSAKQRRSTNVIGEYVVTTRCSDEYRKYRAGDWVLSSPYLYKITHSVESDNSIEDHPLYDELTKEEIATITLPFKVLYLEYMGTK